jgi:CheY-like chemotaxis protein
MASKQQSILVVDDCPVSRGMATSILAACGYDAVECGSGTQCMDFIDKEIPALILLDISMPDIDGFDLLRQIRQRHAADSVPVVLVTASTDGKDVVRGLTTGANDYLTKPLDRTAFLARVYNHISLSQARRQNDEHRQKVVNILGLRRAIEELNHEAIFAQRSDGSLAYCNELLGRVIEGAPALRAEELAVRLMHRDLYIEIRDALQRNPLVTIDRTVQLPSDVQAHGYQSACRLRTAPHGDVRIWVFQFEVTATSGQSDTSTSV